VVRGGAFNNNNNDNNLRCAYRNNNDPTNRNNIGFRVSASHLFCAYQKCSAITVALPRVERWRGICPRRGLCLKTQTGEIHKSPVIWLRLGATHGGAVHSAPFAHLPNSCLNLAHEFHPL
jgi:hypothetical protein